ncbi:hypothetical protein, variant [Verruconis gallopava]|nr:hypothetical protein, variant [Verruconis gallopava]KIW06174.1 hypothetical protein, variant [Verruconis gallopava]
MIHILEFASFVAFEKWYTNPSGASEFDERWKLFRHHKQRGRADTLLAGTTCFIMRTEEGEVFSWGDGRYSRCLGRVPDTQNRADEPSMISALGGIYVNKINGRGWMFGALSKEKALYIWGCDRPGTQFGLHELLDANDGDVRLLDDDRFDDITDFAIGNGHIVIATDQGQIYAIGVNSNGQLGLGEKCAAFVSTWSKVAQLEPSQQFTLAAGDASTFVLSDRRLQH